MFTEQMRQQSCVKVLTHPQYHGLANSFVIGHSFAGRLDFSKSENNLIKNGASAVNVDSGVYCYSVFCV